MSPFEHLLAAAVGIALPIRSIVAAPAAATGAIDPNVVPRARLYVLNAAVLFAGGGVVAGVALLAGHPMAWLGLAAPRDSTGLLVWALLALVVAARIADSWWRLADPDRRARSGEQVRATFAIAPRGPTEYFAFIVLAASAAVSEEIVYRGFLVSYVIDLLGGGGLAVLAAVLGPAAAFGATHWYQGPRAAALIAGLGSFYGALFVVSGSILPIIAAHFVLDLVGSWLAMRSLTSSVDVPNAPGSGSASQ